MIALGSGAAVLVLSLLTVRAVPYVCHEGDSVAGVAQVQYGTDAAIPYIVAQSGLAKAGPCRAGTKLVLPTAGTYKIKRGDRLELIAKQFLGDKRRAPALAQLNNMKITDKLREGQDITIPFLHSHRAEAPESVNAIAKQYYGDVNRGRLIAEFNFRVAPVVPKGERVLVPISAIKLKPPKPATGKAALVRSSLPPSEANHKLEESAAKIATVLEQVTKLLAEGQFSEALLQLDRGLQEEVATEEQMIIALELRATLLVSLGLDDVAVGVFRDLYARKSDFTCDETTTSPKICAAWEKARASAPKAPPQ